MVSNLHLKKITNASNIKMYIGDELLAYDEDLKLEKEEIDGLCHFLNTLPVMKKLTFFYNYNIIYKVDLDLCLSEEHYDEKITVIFTKDGYQKKYVIRS